MVAALPLRTITGVLEIPYSGWISPQPTSPDVCAAPRLTCHRIAYVCASYAYTLLWPVATTSTLCVDPSGIWKFDTIKGCAMTLPSTFSVVSWPKLAEPTVAGVRSVSLGFQPVG